MQFSIVRAGDQLFVAEAENLCHNIFHGDAMPAARRFFGPLVKSRAAHFQNSIFLLWSVGVPDNAGLRIAVPAR